MSANRFLVIATPATHNAAVMAHYVRVNFDQLVLQGCATSCRAFALSPKPAGRLWHSPHFARTLRSAGVRAYREHIDEAAADKVYGKDGRVTVNLAGTGVGEPMVVASAKDAAAVEDRYPPPQPTTGQMNQ
jgi:hypothetical protein